MAIKQILRKLGGNSVMWGANPHLNQRICGGGIGRRKYKFMGISAVNGWLSCES